MRDIQTADNDGCDNNPTHILHSETPAVSVNTLQQSRSDVSAERPNLRPRFELMMAAFKFLVELSNSNSFIHPHVFKAFFFSSVKCKRRCSFFKAKANGDHDF